jgi:hypothetical protein
VDPSGKVTQTTEKISVIELTKNQVENVARCKKLVFDATVNTTNSQNQTVTFYTDYTLDIKVGMMINFNIDL